MALSSYWEWDRRAETPALYLCVTGHMGDR